MEEEGSLSQWGWTSTLQINSPYSSVALANRATIITLLEDIA